MMGNLFTQDPQVRDAVKRIAECSRGRAWSDIVDAEGRQYVDFVMEGGGVLGISLLGYVYALEQAGIRLLGIGGTSAGSIVALILAALGRADQAKAERAVDILAAMPMASFIDGDGDARDFTQAMLAKSGPAKLLFKAAQCIDNLKEDLGLHPGRKFENWLSDVLAKQGVRTLGDLEAVLQQVPPGLKHRLDDAAFRGDRECGRLVIIAADISTETKVDFPRMAPLYWTDPAKVNPARLARASMSIPFFFHPFTVDVPQGEESRKRWEELASYTHPLPKKAMFMDGGIMSNFPINTFHVKNRVPHAPTFGAKIGFDRRARDVTKPAALIGAIFDSARHTLDYDFIVSNPDYRQLVANIDVEDSHNWLNFEMADDEKLQLFVAGVKTAETFLCGEPGKSTGFDWEGYKNLRRTLAAAGG
ncbi:patatin-like phospholipase family protein [Methyloversatilis thermotolerans]|uniref:patatin-like phospholipase family protein n=1 Tax=Methyloversatilis thermotolerans TaxID=1346290 RepID=UPI000379041E|nr:patatin-like phospholipase family protein [Methyloversatilis thermotolerans]